MGDSHIRGLLVDLDGTVCADGTLIPGADDAIDALRGRSVAVLPEESKRELGSALEVYEDPHAVVIGDLGDDLSADVGGAQALGIHGVLVRIGKARAIALDAESIEPDLVVDSLAALPARLLRSLRDPARSCESGCTPRDG